MNIKVEIGYDIDTGGIVATTTHNKTDFKGRGRNVAAALEELGYGLDDMAIEYFVDKTRVVE